MIAFNNYEYSFEAITEKASAITSKPVSGNERATALLTILSCIDLTSLEGTDTGVKIFTMCEHAQSFAKNESGLPNVAAVCFYLPFVAQARKQLEGTGIKVATVAGAFPHGQAPTEIKRAEVEYAVKAGAHEVDVVIARGYLLANQCNEMQAQLEAMRLAAGNTTLKVILETGELETVYKIRRASEIALNAGADFLKTSTGKTLPAATPQAVFVMLETIKEFYEKTGKMVGIKPSGGIADADEAIKYYLLVKGILGEAWLDKKYFRIGASRLADKVATEIRG
ncbi:MAG: deoxyribose-phosphate aldolase [Clostridia bacterium]|nr:deoxyribose-phosphate aldolase [Clostridia bacterium]